MKKLVFTLLTVLFCAPAFAQSQTNVSAADMDRLTTYFSQFVVQTTRPFTLFSWFNSGSRDPKWKTQFSPDDPAGYDHFVANAARYFQYECPVAGTDMSQIPAALEIADCQPQTKPDNGASNMFGPGLYGAVDPYLTYQNYGQGVGFVLMQIKMPAGYRMIDAQVANAMMLAKQPDSGLQSLLSSLGCPASYGGMTTLLNPNSMHGQECSYMMRAVLRRLKVGAFSYPYSSSQSQMGCPGTPVNLPSLSYNDNFLDRAFVFISETGLSPQNIKIFNAQSGNTLNAAGGRASDPNNFNYNDRYEITNVIAHWLPSGPLPWADTKVLEDQTTSLNRMDAYAAATSYGCQATSPVMPAR